MRYTNGYFSTLEEGWEKGSIPKPILENIFSLTGYLNTHKLPLFGIALSTVGLMLAVI